MNWRYILRFSILLIIVVLPLTASAAILSLSPNSGTFSVGSTFDVSIFLDTQGKSINVIDVASPSSKRFFIIPSLAVTIL